ncbi:hypothetical protein ACGFZR_09365 [Streptomyces sp. NPDC048241]|uniref:hypothetical protein n=1 Tax=Streptomyces sp. NPDC048241 TaxID=3365521 RepID=UPI00371950A1
MGSIKGGSAAKHIMYHHVCGECRLAAPLRGREPQEARARLRGQFVQGTKTLATYFPERFLPIYAGEHLRRFAALLLGGSVQADAPAWRSNRHLLELVPSEAEFEGWTRYEVMPVDVKYKRYDRHGVSAPDLHQLLTYSSGYSAADAPGAVIVHPQPGSHARQTLQLLGSNDVLGVVHVFGIDTHTAHEQATAWIGSVLRLQWVSFAAWDSSPKAAPPMSASRPSATPCQ